jgi:tetratricopeptide (TPR) repeat protein
MSEENSFTESEAQLFFAKQFNGKAWELLDKRERSQEENELLIDYAHASLAHWRAAGTGMHLQRGVWMLARVNTVLGNSQLATQYAQRCLELTEQHKELLADFDFAFAYESMARTQALAGNRAEALKYWDMADKAGAAILDEEDRQIFFDDFNAGDWYGLK